MLCCFVCLLLHEARRMFSWWKCTFKCLRQITPDIIDVITETTQKNRREPKLLRSAGLGAWLIFYEPATRSGRKIRTPDTTISYNLILNSFFNNSGHLCWHELDDLSTTRGWIRCCSQGLRQLMLIVLDIDLSVISSPSMSDRRCDTARSLINVYQTLQEAVNF